MILLTVFQMLAFIPRGRNNQQRVLGREEASVWIFKVTSQTSTKELVAKAESRRRGVSGVGEGRVGTSLGRGGAVGLESSSDVGDLLHGSFLYSPTSAPARSLEGREDTKRHKIEQGRMEPRAAILARGQREGRRALW